MIFTDRGITVVQFGHCLIKVDGYKSIGGTAYLGLACNEGDMSTPLDPAVVLSFSTRKSIEIVMAQLEGIKDFLYEDPNEIELEYC